MRWLSILLPLALIFSTLGRGHVFQMMGLAIACEHPDAAQVEPTSKHAPAGAADMHDHCPPDCHRCPCGQIPVMPPAQAPFIAAVIEFLELPGWLLSEKPGQSHAHRLDRPPRHRTA
jgi:hypothetical protein